MQCCMLQAGAAVSHLCMMDCRMEAKGVTPMPVPMSTACCAWKIRLVGAPKGPSMKTCCQSVKFCEGSLTALTCSELLT